jgi:predicted O-linked N-acetylglucosamine transferase (SPINDLY family)
MLIAAGNRREREGRFAEACGRYRAAIRVAPRYAAAHVNLGIGLEASGDFDAAARAYLAALQLAPEDAYANYNLGKLRLARGELGESLERLERAVRARPRFPEALVMLAHAREAVGDLSGAAASLESALEQRPGYAGALLNYASLLARLQKWPEAQAALRQCAAADPSLPGLASAHCHIGNLLADQGRLEEACSLYRKALELAPGHEEARANLCLALSELGFDAEARLALDELLARNAGFARGQLALGAILFKERKFAQAAEALQRALALDPRLAAAHAALGNIYGRRGEHAQALREYSQARAIEPENAEVRWAEAVAHLKPVYDSETDSSRSRAAFTEALGELERWMLPERHAQAVKAVGRPAPFYLAYQEANNRDLLGRYGNLCARTMAAAYPVPTSDARRTQREGLRVAIVSAHFQNHSVWNALAKGWFERRDPARFELEAYYLGSEPDQETAAARSLASHFEDRHRGLERWIEVIRERRPDVLVYPEIGMDALTMQLASLRLAPVQVASWGHPETSGLPTIDWYLSAEGMEPPAAQQHYTERLLLLPNLGCSYRSRGIVPVVPDRERLGLDKPGPLLVCPGTPYKYAPRYDAVLSRIAAGLGECTLAFFTFQDAELSELLHARLRSHFAAQGLDASKFIRFLPWQTPAHFRGILGCADVFLDTIGFSGFNTVMEAVEAGLPIVTRRGGFLRGRFGAAILDRLGLAELVAETEADYAGVATRLCSDGPYRSRIRARIAESRRVLFEDPAPAQAFQDHMHRLAAESRA